MVNPQSKGMIWTTSITFIVMVTFIKFVASNNGNSNPNANNLEPSDFQAPIIQRPYLDPDNRLSRYLIDRFAPFIVARTSPLEESSMGLADLVRKEARFKKMFTSNYDDMMIPVPSDRYNKKDNSVYKDAFVGVRG